MQARVVIAALLLTVGLVGCGGNDDGDDVASANGSTSSPSSSASTGSGSERDQTLRYTRCMRENGVPNYPDPDENGNLSLDADELGMDPNGSQFKAADEKCKHYLPNGGEPQQLDPQQLERLRHFAQCIRQNGFPDFPDPTDQGFQINGNEHPEWGPDNPRYKAAEEKCNAEAGLEGGSSGNETGGST